MSKKKKILFFHFSLQGGGAERVLVNLLKFLDRDKYDISLKTIFGVGPYVKAIPDDVKFSSVFKREFRGFSKIMSFLPGWFWHRLFIHDRYDIEVAYLENSPTRIIAASPDKQAKKVAWVHTEVTDKGLVVLGFKNENEMIKAHNRLDHLVFVSRRAKDCFASIFPNIDNPQLHVIHNVNDFDKIHELAEVDPPININKDKLNLFLLGRLIHVKGVNRLIDAFSRLRDDGCVNDVNVYVLGDGEERDALRVQIDKEGLSDTIHLLGFDPNPYRYLAKMDLFVCTSYREGYSTATTEAIALGIPVFTTDCSGMDEILDNGKYGMIVPNDDEAIYEGLKELLTHREKINQYAAAIKAAPPMTTQALVNKYEEFFDSL